MNRPSYLLFKQCNKCGEILHISKFYKKQTGKYGVDSICKICRNKINKEYYENNKNDILEHQKEYYENNKERKKEYDKEYRINNKKHIKENKKEYYENNKEHFKEKSKEHYRNNKEYVKEYQKGYRINNKDKIKEYKKHHYENNIEKYFNNRHNRRLKENTQGNGITKEQWKEMMDFFDWKCAYSGEYIGGDSDKRTIDHIIALDNGGEHEIWNLVPMYFNYNSSKGAKNMLEWYLEQEYFDIERLTKIYEWRIYAYWKWKNEI